MKISTETQTILKNFASINGNIAFKAGEKLSTISPQRNVVAMTEIAEKFSEDFYIYDLSQFLGVLSLFEDPEVEFTDTVATITEGNNSIEYHAASRDVLLLPPDKQIKFPGADVTLTMTAAMLNAIQKTSSVLSAPDLSIVGDGKTLVLRVSDLKNPSTNSYKVEVGETDKTFTANIAINNLKLISQDYTVEISSKKISKWTSGKMTIYVALEATSDLDNL